MPLLQDALDEVGEEFAEAGVAFNKPPLAVASANPHGAEGDNATERKKADGGDGPHAPAPQKAAAPPTCRAAKSKGGTALARLSAGRAPTQSWGCRASKRHTSAATVATTQDGCAERPAPMVKVAPGRAQKAQR